MFKGLKIACLFAFSFALIPQVGALAAEFQIIDAEGSGNVSRQNLADYNENKFNESDTNGDGVITMDESQAKAKQIFEQADKDSSGWLSEEEYVLYNVSAMPEAYNEKKVAAKPVFGSPMAMFDLIDVEGDGNVTEEEYAVYFGNFFDATDTNADKQASADEVIEKVKADFNGMDLNHDGAIAKEEYIICIIGKQQ